VSIKWIIAPMLPKDPPPLPTAGSAGPGRTITLICMSSASCPSFGNRLPVTLEVVAPGVLARPNFVCADCLMELAMITEKEEHRARP
jgi:hypothetical protein